MKKTILIIITILLLITFAVTTFALYQQKLNTTNFGDKPCFYRSQEGGIGSYYPKDFNWPKLPDGSTADLESPKQQCDQSVINVIVNQK
jgi:hypothetical protein